MTPPSLKRLGLMIASFTASLGCGIFPLRLCVGEIFCFIAGFSEMPVTAVVKAQRTGLQSQPLYLMSVHVGTHSSQSSHHSLIKSMILFSSCYSHFLFFPAVVMFVTLLLFINPDLVTECWYLVAL